MPIEAPFRRRVLHLRRALAGALALGSVAAAASSARADDEAPKPAVEQAIEAPKPPTVSFGKPRLVKPGAMPKGVETALLAVKPAVEACYKEAIDVGHDGAPTVELRMELVGPGRVASASINSSLDASSRLRGCVRDAFAGVAAGGVGPAPVEVLLTISFDRDVPDDLVLSASSCPSTCGGDLGDELKKEIKARAQRAGHCFKRAAAPGEAPVLKAGEMQVGVRIAADGSVCGVTTGNDGFDRPSLTSCIVETMSGAFTETPTGCVDVSIPLVFKGN